MLNTIFWYGFLAVGFYAIWKLMRDD